MSTNWTRIVIVLLLGLAAIRAAAMGEVVLVTRQNQEKLGLRFTLTAERVSNEAVLVRIEAPRQGKLRGLRLVSMTVGREGTPLVHAPLYTTAGKDGAWVATFQLSPELADRCTVDLTTPFDPPSARSYLIYAVELKGYITERKPLDR
jgi:hypothetical protein